MPPPTRYHGPPMTLANMRENGVRSLAVTCELCHRGAAKDQSRARVIARPTLSRQPGLYFVVEPLLSEHFLKQACVFGEGKLPGESELLHLTSQALLSCVATDPPPPRPPSLESAEVGVKALAMAMAVTIVRSLAFIGKPSVGH
jgi:hypothetical protein